MPLQPPTIITPIILLLNWASCVCDTETLKGKGSMCVAALLPTNTHLHCSTTVFKGTIQMQDVRATNLLPVPTSLSVVVESVEMEAKWSSSLCDTSVQLVAPTKTHSVKRYFLSHSVSPPAWLHNEACCWPGAGLLATHQCTHARNRTHAHTQWQTLNSAKTHKYVHTSIYPHKHWVLNFHFTAQLHNRAPRR